MKFYVFKDLFLEDKRRKALALRGVRTVCEGGGGIIYKPPEE
jgi:hypothetical protein